MHEMKGQTIRSIPQIHSRITFIPRFAMRQLPSLQGPIGDILRVYSIGMRDPLDRHHTAGSLYLAQPLVLSISNVSGLTSKVENSRWGQNQSTTLKVVFKNPNSVASMSTRSHSGNSVIRTKSTRFAMHLPRPLHSSSPTS